MGSFSPTSQSINYVLVTGATGFIGAHVVDQLLSRGLRVRGATRSRAKGEAMMRARPRYSSMLDFVEIDDFGSSKPGGLDDAVRDVDAVVHVASPLCYDVKDAEKELIIPAMNGVKGILSAAAKSNVKRVVLTSSFASVMNVDRKGPHIYTGSDWNPLSYEEAAASSTPPHIAYRGAKKFAERAAWDFVREKKPNFDLVTLCPSMTFGPVVHPIDGTHQLNETNAMLWKIARGEPLAKARVWSWIDVRDLATAHVEALMRPETSGKRYIPCGPERFSYDLAASIMAEEFDWAKGKVRRENQVVDQSYGIDGETTARELGFEYTEFRKTIADTISQFKEIDERA